jgi:DNA polymerase V
MAQPVFQIKRLIKQDQVAVFSGNFQLYGDFSNRVMQHLHDFTPDLEVYSIDEAFLGLDDHIDLLNTGHTIRKAVLQQQKIPVSIGIASTKTLAKIAAELAKTSPKAQGVVNLVDSPYLEEGLKRVPVQSVWGVGWNIGQTLRYKGIVTAYDLTLADDAWLKKEFSVVFLRTVSELRGIPCLDIDYQPANRLSVITSRSVTPTIQELDILKELIAGYATRTAEKLREEGMEANGLSVFIRTAKYREEPQYYGSEYMDLPIATHNSSALIQNAQRLLKNIFKPGYSYYKAGVMAVNLTPLGAHQVSLFAPPAVEDKLSPVVDSLNNHYGYGTLKYLAEGLGQRWRAKQESRSPLYTTSLNDLPVVT